MKIKTLLLTSLIYSSLFSSETFEDLNNSTNVIPKFSKLDSIKKNRKNLKLQEQQDLINEEIKRDKEMQIALMDSKTKEKVTEKQIIIEQKKKSKRKDKHIEKSIENDNNNTPQTNKDKVISKKISPEAYTNLINMLTSTSDVIDVQKIASEQRRLEESEIAAKEARTIAEKEFEEILLPIPTKSISLGDKIIVYANYREKTLDDKAKTITSIQPTDLKKTIKEKTDNYIFIKKEIKLKLNDVFGAWTITQLNSNYIEYKNKEKSIKKYY